MQSSNKSDLLKSFLDENSQHHVHQLITVEQILSMCYFQYLENRKFLNYQTEYLYGDLLKQADVDQVEAILIFLEMLKIYFPAGKTLGVVNSHDTAASKNNFFTSDIGPQDQIAIQLISRIFCLVPLKCKSIEEGKEIQIKSADYDIAQFCSYIKSLRFIMKGIFQSILYRIFRSGRGHIDQFSNAD